MPVYKSRQLRTKWSHEIYSLDDLYWYPCTIKKHREASDKRLHPKGPVFGFEEAVPKPLALLSNTTSVFVVMNSDTRFVIRFNGTQEEVTEENVSEYLTFYNVPSSGLSGGSLFGAYETFLERGLFGLNAGVSRNFDAVDEEPSFEAILVNPTLEELGPYVRYMISSSDEQPYYETEKRDGQFYPNLTHLLSA